MMPQSFPVDQGITWSLPQLDELRFMRAKYVQHAFKPHAHDYFVLGIIEDGVQSFTHQRKHLITTPGEVIVINPGEMHTGESAIREGFTYRALYPSSDLMQTMAREFNNKADIFPYFTSGIVHDSRLFRQFQYVHHLSETADNGLQLEEGLTEFFVQLIRQYATDKRTLNNYSDSSQAVFLVRDYLEAHYADNISLTDLSAQAHISPYHLARLFRQHMGMPPHKYLENVRIRHAEHLLTAGMPIADIAYATGFSSQSHLTRTFKRFIGTTPGAYVQQRKIV